MAAAGPLIVDVARLARGGERFSGETGVEALDLDAASREFFTPVGGLVYDVFAQLLGDELLVRGSVRQRLRCLCARCSGTYDWEASDPELTCAIQPGADDAFVDLTPELREAIILSLPSHPVCHDGCQGLCPQCGADLNQGPCGCPPRRDDLWGLLEGLGDAGREARDAGDGGAGEKPPQRRRQR